MKRHPIGQTVAGLLLATIGIAIVLIELARNWLGFDPTGPHMLPLSIGAVFFVFGSYLCVPRTTKAAVTFIVDQSTRVIRVVRTGRRSTDMMAITDSGEIKAPIVPAVTRVIPPTYPGVEDIEMPPPSRGSER